MPTGHVKWFNATKGFGFITTDEGSDLFVHGSSVEANEFSPLGDGQPVSFEVGDGPKGPQAIEVRATGPAPSRPPRRDGYAERFNRPPANGGPHGSRRLPR